MWILEHPVLPCPFCGNDKILALDIAAPLSMLQCPTCQAQGPIGETHALAETGWQTRGTPIAHFCWFCRDLFTPAWHGQHYCDAACEAKAILQRETEAQQRETLLHQERTKRAEQQRRREERRQQRRELQRQQQLAYEQKLWDMAVS